MSSKELIVDNVEVLAAAVVAAAEACCAEPSKELKLPEFEEASEVTFFVSSRSLPASNTRFKSDRLYDTLAVILK